MNCLICHQPVIQNHVTYDQTGNTKRKKEKGKRKCICSWINNNRKYPFSNADLPGVLHTVGAETQTHTKKRSISSLKNSWGTRRPHANSDYLLVLIRCPVNRFRSTLVCSQFFKTISYRKRFCASFTLHT